MTTPVSTVPAVSSYLLSAIQTAAENDAKYQDMLIVLGVPSANLPNDVICIGEVRRSTDPETFRGNGGMFWLAEKYSISIVIASWSDIGDVFGQSEVANQVNDRAWQLENYVESAIRQDPSLGGLVDIAYPANVTTDGPDWNAGANLNVQLTMTVRVEKLN